MHCRLIGGFGYQLFQDELCNKSIMVNIFGQLNRIRLEEDPIVLNESEEVSVFTELLNSVRIYHIPLVNFVIIGLLGTFLEKLTTKYTELYMKNSLITIIVTNLVLYGISETLAQSILSYKPSQPMISFKMYSGSIGGISLASDNFLQRASNLEEGSIDREERDEDIMDRFIEYIEEENETNRDRSSILSQDLNPFFIEPTYFKFSRLAGFMCWGFVMAFVQCWWYKFLQIYSKDPKFIEVLRKVLTDQLCYSPISLACFFTYGTLVLENGTWEDAKAKLNKIYIKTLLINYSVWFPVQFFNFLIIPRSFQVPFSSSVSVLWNCFLSMRNSKS